MAFVMKRLLSAQTTMESQKKGKSGQLVDPRPQTVDGEIKIVITPQLVHDIFEEYPVVGKAYSENVPSKVRPCHIKAGQDKFINGCHSSPQRSFGNVTLSQNCSTRTGHPSGLLRHSTS